MIIFPGQIVSPPRTVSTEVVTVVERLTTTSFAKMLEGSATIKMTISAGRRRIFRLLIAIALMVKFFEAPLLAEGGLLISSNRQANIFIFSSEGVGQNVCFRAKQLLKKTALLDQKLRLLNWTIVDLR